MLYIIAIAFIVLWLLGLITPHTMGGTIPVLLIIASIMITLNFIHGRRVL